MSLRKTVWGTLCCLMAIAVLISQNNGIGPSIWSYRIALLSASSLSDDGERFLIGCDNGQYFLLDRFGNVILNSNFERAIHAVDIASNGNMIFGIENGAVLLDEQGTILSKKYPTGPVFHVSMAENGLYAIAGTEKEVFLMTAREVKWESKIILEDQPNTVISMVTISSSGSAMAAAAQKTIYLFNSESSSYKSKIDFESVITCLVFLPNANDVVVGTQGGSICIYDIEGNLKFSYFLGSSVNSIAVNSERILVGTSEGEIVLFEKNEKILQKNVTEGSVYVCDISDDGTSAVVLDSRDYVSSFNIETGDGWSFYVRDPISVELSHDGKYVGIERRSGIYFINNWENVFEGTQYLPYASRGFFCLENDLYKVWSYPSNINCFDCGDINGDGLNEIVLGSGTELIVLDHLGRLVWKNPFPGYIETVKLFDVTQDAVPEIILGFDDGRLNLEVWSGEEEHLASFDFMDTFMVTSHPGIMSMEPIAVMDIDQDGMTEIISRVRIGYGGKAGGVFAFEYPSGEKEWFFPIAPFQVSHALTDIDNDGSLEFVLGSQSSCKGTAVDQKDDCHVYVMVINLGGSEIWTKEVDSGRKLLLVAVSDLDGNGKKEIIGTVRCEDNAHGKLFVLDYRGNCIHQREFDNSVCLGGIADFDEDGFQEVVITNSRDTIAVYDRELELKRYTKVEGDTTHVEGISDLDGDGDLEIVAITDNQKLLILDKDLNELASMKISEESRASLAHFSGCAADLLVHSPGEIGLFSLRNERKRLCFLAEEKILRTWPLQEEILKEANGYFSDAESYYKNLEFEKANESYKKAKELFEKTGSVGRILECTRMLEIVEDLAEAQNRISSGRENLKEGDYKKAEYDFYKARVLIEMVIEKDALRETNKWLLTQIDYCNNHLRACDEIGAALKDFRNGEEELRKQNYEKAKEYFDSALPVFEKYEVEQFHKLTSDYLKEIDQIMKKDDGSGMIGIYSLITVFLSPLLVAAFLLFAVHFNNVRYRNENHSTPDSLVYTLQQKGFPFLSLIKKFPIFSHIENPYYTGNPVENQCMFFGREDVKEFLQRELITSIQNNVIIFYGEMKTGKTSILFQIKNGKLRPGSEFIPIYINMNEITTNDDHEFLLHLASVVQEALEVHQIQIPQISSEGKKVQYLSFRRDFLHQISDLLGEKHIIFLIDEYDAIEKRIADGKMSKDIFSFLKTVIEHETKFNFIFAGSKRIEEFANHEEWLHALSSGVHRRISFLKKKDAEKLITNPVSEKVWFTHRAVESLIGLSGCHPYILQYFCFNLVSLLNETRSHSVDIDKIEKVVQDIIQNPMPQMTLSWMNLTLEQKKLTSLLAEVEQENSPIAQEKIMSELKKRSLELNGNVSAILQELESKEILVRKEDKYLFSVDILRRFVAEYFPLSRVITGVKI